MDFTDRSSLPQEADVFDHGLRSADVAFLLSAVTGLGNRRRQVIALGALFQNIGLVFAPAGPSSVRPADIDAQLFASHPVAGAEFLQRSAHLDAEIRGQVCAIVMAHHERVDGLGFPDGLQGDAIPAGARIVAIADAFARRVAHAPERRQTRMAAVKAISADAGKRFDPFYVDALRRLVETDLDILVHDYAALFARDGTLHAMARNVLRDAHLEREREVGFLDSLRASARHVGRRR